MGFGFQPLVPNVGLGLKFDCSFILFEIFLNRSFLQKNSFELIKRAAMSIIKSRLTTNALLSRVTDKPLLRLINKRFTAGCFIANLFGALLLKICANSALLSFNDS